MRPDRRRAAGLAALAALGLALTVSNPIATSAARYNGEIAASASALYGSLRVANSMMSIVKDADIGGSALVANLSASPGQALEPVTDTIERMADFLFAMVVVAGLLTVLLKPAATLGAALMALCAGALALLALAGREREGAPRRALRAGLSLGLLAGLLVPAAYGAAFAAGDAMTAQAWGRATAVFERLSGDYGGAIEESVAPPVAAPPVPSAPAEAEDGALGTIASGLASAYRRSSEALSGTAAAARDFATSIPDRIARNALAVRDGLEIAADLFQACIAIATATLVKLVVLPLAIILSVLWIARRAMTAPLVVTPRLGDADAGREHAIDAPPSPRRLPPD
ncbi:hypothetical protein [Aurantimonas sp. Leaf443]|uniref:hypothetical protein n=1 Tax=Aurantimonas sp. Leaf443 TaxID=1736378 RepID=UPI0006FF696E|nr:hypothetical protein [Aurantimonas sp. Leaf443]KQT88028.1 hypothetical protein ASG48_00815 [Aurantimonas sp. Leaf443]